MTSGKWWSFYGTRGDQDGAALFDVRCACCGEFVTRHDLTELPGKCPRCGEGAMTNYEKLFGTPEKAAWTLANACAKCDDNFPCWECPLSEIIGSNVYEPELLEWLESEVRDD